MSVATVEIKYLENSLEMLNQFGTELNLDNVLAEEFEAGIASDVNNLF